MTLRVNGRTGQGAKYVMLSHENGTHIKKLGLTARVTVSLLADERQGLLRLALAEGRTASQVMREILLDHLSRS